MNYWKRVWDIYHREATRWAYLKELWCLSGWVTRLALIVSAVIFMFGLLTFRGVLQQNFPWLLVVGEFALLAVVYHMKGTIFRCAYGSADEDISPADDGDHQVGRFLMFKRKLREAQITKSHVEDLFDLLDAKEGLESQRNTLVNKFFLFVSGFFTALSITLIRGLSFDSALKLLLWLLVVCACVGPLLWVLPSRREKLRELKYFMLLYCKSLGG